MAIEVIDDGKGLDADRLERKAVEKGLICRRGCGGDRKGRACQLIFTPRSLNRRSSNNVSGRGVGMDVVVNNIQKLKGTVGIESRAGYGTTIRIDCQRM